MSTLKHKRIPLTPTDFVVDAWIGDNVEEISKAWIDEYGYDSEFYEQFFTETTEGIVIQLEDREGITRFLASLPKLTPAVVLHECIHLSWYLDNQVGYNFSFSNQEIQAQYVEYLFKEIMSIK